MFWFCMSSWFVLGVLSLEISCISVFLFVLLCLMMLVWLLCVMVRVKLFSVGVGWLG